MLSMHEADYGMGNNVDGISTPPIAPVAPAYPAGWIGVGGAVLALVGSLLPWATITLLGRSLSIAGTHGDGKITLVVALAVAGLLFAAVVNQNDGLAVAAGVSAALGLAVSIYD